MAKYQKYAEYIHTDNNWIKEIPYGWKIVPLKYMCKGFVKDGPHETPVFVDEGIPFLSVDGIQNNKLVFESCRYISKEDDARFSLKCKPQKGNVLLGKAASVGKVAFVDTEIDFNVWSPLAVINPSDKKLGKYIFYCLQSYELQLQCDVFSNSNTQKNLGMTTIDNLSFPYPSFNEGQTISHFLDHETAKIDTLIAKQEKLIELLKEKRQAVISHAVTKGLNPNVPMKDSGVKWLGKVPEHWEVRQLRYLGSCQNGINIGAEYFGSGSSFISYGDVYRNPELPRVFDGLVQSTENDKRIYSVQRGDVLFTRTSETIEEIGFSSTCLTDIKDATFAGFLIRFRPIQNTLLPEYSKFYFRNILLRAFFVKEMNLVTRASLSQELLKKLAVPFPSLEEQKQIADYLSAKERVFDKLVNDCIKQIELLKERRTALISAAVTGKIDVRNWQNPVKNNNQDNMELSA